VEVKEKLSALAGGDVFPQAVYSGGRVVAEVRYIAKPTTNEPTFCYWRRAAWPNDTAAARPTSPTTQIT